MFALRAHACPSDGAQPFQGHPFTVSASAQKHPASEAHSGPVSPAGGSRVAESLALLAHDETLIATLEGVIPAGSLTLVADEAALATQLLSGHTGVVLIDAGAIHPQPGAASQLIQRLHQQFPDVVLVVAGDGAAQSELITQVGDGTIYRFVHKPVSAQRVKLFVEAAWRKRDGGTSGIYQALAPPQATAVVAAPPRALPRPAMLAAVAVIGAAATWLMLLRTNSPVDAEAPLHAAAPRAMLPSPAAARRAAVPSPTAPPRAAVPSPTTPPRAARTAAAAKAAATAAAATATAEATANTAANAAIRQLAAAPAAFQISPTVADSTRPTRVASDLDWISPPSSSPPASEARDRNSLAAVLLQRTYWVNPVFPDAAREQDLTGFVDLEFTVHADGSVADVTVLRAQPPGIFEQSAVAAVSQWRYRPVERDGVPIEADARLRLNFGIK